MKEGVALVDIKYYLSLIEKIPDSEEIIKELDSKPIHECEKGLWRKYKRLVWKITKKQNLKKLSNFENRGFKNYHLDHKVSIWYGYKNKLDPKMIGSIDNLEFIPYKDNMIKSTKCNFKNTKCLQSVIFI